MNKDYKFWHKLKTDIHNYKQRAYFYEGEIWFCNLGMNVGFEQDGKGTNYLRPVLIVKKFNKQVLWGVPLTRTAKFGKYYHPIKFEYNARSFLILSQIRLLDSKRLEYRIGVISEDEMLLIKQKIKQLLE